MNHKIISTLFLENGEMINAETEFLELIKEDHAIKALQYSAYYLSLSEDYTAKCKGN